MTEIKVLTLYIAAWMWHIIGVIFLIQAINFLISREYIWMAGFAGVVLVCEIYAWKRKKEIENEN